MDTARRLRSEHAHYKHNRAAQYITTQFSMSLAPPAPEIGQGCSQPWLVKGRHHIQLSQAGEHCCWAVHEETDEAAEGQGCRTRAASTHRDTQENTHSHSVSEVFMLMFQSNPPTNTHSRIAGSGLEHGEDDIACNFKASTWQLLLQ
jgi:hypothetical protein